MTENTNKAFGKVWVILGLFVVVSIGVGVFVVIRMNQTAQTQQNATSASTPSSAMPIEKKLNVLGQLAPSTTAGATTTSAAEKQKQETVKSVSATSASSTQSTSEKLDVLKSLQH